MIETIAAEALSQSPVALVLFWAVFTLSQRMDMLNATLITTLDRLAAAALRAPEK